MIFGNIGKGIASAACFACATWLVVSGHGGDDSDLMFLIGVVLGCCA